VGASQVARGEVVPVAELTDRLLDAELDLGGDAQLAVHDPGDGLEAHSGEGGDVAHRGPGPASSI
jgi:hypothetical protein